MAAARSACRMSLENWLEPGSAPAPAPALGLTSRSEMQVVESGQLQIFSTGSNMSVPGTRSVTPHRAQQIALHLVHCSYYFPSTTSHTLLCSEHESCTHRDRTADLALRCCICSISWTAQCYTWCHTCPVFAGYTCHLQFSVLGTSSPGVLHRTWLRLVLVAGAGVVVVLLGGAVVESSHTPAGRWSVQQCGDLDVQFPPSFPLMMRKVTLLPLSLICFKYSIDEKYEGQVK